LYVPNRGAMSETELSTAEMATPMASHTAVNKKRHWLVSVAAVLAAVGISVGIVLLRDHIRGLGIYGYPGVFLVSFIGNATLLLPAPSYAVVFAVGSALNPIAVGIVAGLGAALGELTGFLAGVGGRAVFEERALYRRLEKRMQGKGGVLVIFLLALVPNPAFDIGGIVAGTLRMPVWQFVLAAWAGKSIRFILVAFSGQYLLGS
jgi:membrane protein YqaA with SNARE-associated domain